MEAVWKIEAHVASILIANHTNAVVLEPGGQVENFPAFILVDDKGRLLTRYRQVPMDQKYLTVPTRQRFLRQVDHVTDSLIDSAWLSYIRWLASGHVVFC